MTRPQVVEAAPNATTPITSAAVRIVDVDMSINSMILFMLKWAIASVPALIILGIIGFMIAAGPSVLVAGLGISRP